jgi:hypothetical protein
VNKDEIEARLAELERLLRDPNFTASKTEEELEALELEYNNLDEDLQQLLAEEEEEEEE